MGLIGYEIVQSRLYQDNNPPAPPSMNYKYTFPKTVYDAVRRSMDDANSTTLTEDIDNIYKELRSKQPIIPALDPTNIITYGGIAGSIGAIRITEKISWDPTKWSNVKIPTEKAVGDLLYQYGVLEKPKPGETPKPVEKKIIWSDIIGRPTIYDDFGDDEEGIINQKALTEIINSLKTEIGDANDELRRKIFEVDGNFTDHVNDFDNPHKVTIEHIGAAAKTILDNHLNNFNNPHNVTLEQLGIPNVDNTSDLDKPISNATQDALDKLGEMLDSLSGKMGLMNFVTRIEYNQHTGRLDAIYADGSRLGVTIVTDGLVDEIQFDEKKHVLKVIELSGHVTNIPLDVLYNKYLGSEGVNIVVEIGEDNVVNATIIPKSITSDEIADKGIKTSVLADEAVTGDKIKDCTITTIKYADHSITSQKIAKGGVETENIQDRAVNGEKLFTSSIDNRVLAVRTRGTNPQWTQIIGEMVASKVIDEHHLVDEAVTESKLGEYAVTETRIKDLSVTTRKLADLAVTTDKLADDSVTSEKIVADVLLRGIPRMELRPDITAEDNQMVDAGWVREVLSKNAITEENIGRRVINGHHLFSSNVKNRALIVTEVDGDPWWGQINTEMIEDGAIDTDKLKDLAVTTAKIGDEAIQARNIGRAVIERIHIKDGNVTSEKIFPSDKANRVLAAIKDDGYPLYTQVLEDMIANESVTNSKIRDRSITPSKMARVADPNTVLAFTLSDKDPQWMKVITELIAEHAVTPSKIYQSEYPNMVLAARDQNTSARYMKVNGEMIEDESIVERHLTEKCIKGKHIADKTIEARNMGPDSVEAEALAPNSVTGRALFDTHESYQVLSVKKDPHADAEWSKVLTEMIADHAVTPSKLFSSNFNYRVMAVSKAGADPEYVLVTGDYIKDLSIPSQKLMANLQLYGHPTIEEHPANNSNDYTIADTYWVKYVINEALKGFTPPTPPTLSVDDIPDHSITGKKLFTSNIAPRVLGVDTPGGDVKYLQVITDMIKNAAVTNDKIERDIKLLGSPSIEVRPGPTYSDKTGKGNIIPDCQWVLDRIMDERKSLYDELKEKICCLKDTDPMKVRHDRIIVEPISTDSLPMMFDAVRDGKRVPVGDSEPFEVDGELLEPISYSAIRNIILGVSAHSESRPIAINGNTIESIPYYRINGLIDGTVTPNTQEPGFEVDIESINSDLCCYDCQDSWNSKSYLVPITDRIIDQLINGTAIAEATKSVTVYGKTIEPIPISKVSDITEDRIKVNGHGFDNVEINGDYLEPIPFDRLREIILGTADIFRTTPMDITEYEEEIESEKELTPGSVITDFIQDRAVTGEKLFTSTDPNMVLGVIDANTDPIWTKIKTDMVEDRAIDGSKLFTSPEDGLLLGVLKAGEDPVWTKILASMLDDDSVDTRHIRDNAVTTSKIMDHAITAIKLAKEKMIETFHIFDFAVTNRKIADGAVTNNKIEDHTIKGVKIAKRTEIPAYTTVEEHSSYKTRGLRNTILSPKNPTEGKNGDIWFQFA
ncbi:MAG: hypothetical protein NC131_16395 [Roseburia sp.]|nr:hypothetical protein [Roseburia sp.]